MILFNLFSEPLKVVMKPENILKGKEGDTITVECSIEGKDGNIFEYLAFEWIKDLKPIHFDSRIKLFKPNVLHIVSMNKEDKGMYQCLVKWREDNQLKVAVSLELSLYGKCILECI
jgi:down syndrome cell adhesion molecule